MPGTETSLGAALTARARWAIASALGIKAEEPVTVPAMAERGACFVTLTLDGELRGCIGSLQAQRPLAEDVAANAVAAALHDRRFAPLDAEEFGRVRVEVSLLTRPEFLDFRDEADALARLRPGVDGVIFFNGCQRSTFLPQVWEQLPEPAEFMRRLKEKAGLAPGFWGPNVMLATYRVDKFSEPA